MKYVYALLTISLHFIIVLILKLLDNYTLILLIFIGSLFIGLVIRSGAAKNNTQVKDAGWGLRAGSLISIIAIALFMFLIKGSIT
jgi:hypothetical protein